MSRREDEVTLLLVRGTVAGLSDGDQVAVKAAAEKLRAVIKEAGPAGIMALALVGAELQIDAEGGL